MIDVPGAKPKRKAAAVKPRSKQKRSAGFTKHADAHNGPLHDVDRDAWLVLNEFYARVRRMPGGPLGLDAGQCVCGSRQIAKLLGVDRGIVRRAIKRLVDLYGFITIAPRATGTVVTIPFVVGGPVTTRNLGNDSRDQSTHPRPNKRPTQVSTELRHSANGSDPHDQAARSRPTKRPLTETEETGETGVGAARHNSKEEPGKENMSKTARRVRKLHAYQEERRAEVLGESYRPIKLGAVSAQIAARLAEQDYADCKRVVRADAEEVKGDPRKARHFGVTTWSLQNFEVKLPKQLQAEHARRARRNEERAARKELDQLPPKQRFFVEQRRLNGLVRWNDGASERDVLLAKYDEFTPKFHTMKGTWPDVRRYRDREARTWMRREEVSDDHSE